MTTKEYRAGPIRRRPLHPGAIIKRDLDALGISVNAAAVAIGVTRAALGKVVNEKAAISPEMSLRLARYFRNSPEFFLRLQNNLDLWDAAQSIGAVIELIEPADWDREEIEG